MTALLPVPKPVTVLSRMEVSGHVLGMLDDMAAKHGLSRDDYLSMAVMLWISYENNELPRGRDAGEIARKIIAKLEQKVRDRDAAEGFGGWGS